MRRVLTFCAAHPLAVSPAAFAAEHASLWERPLLAASSSGYVPISRDVPVFPPSTETMLALGSILVILAAFGGFLLRLIYLKSMAILADARLALAEKRSQLATVPAPSSHNAPSLSASEIDNLLAAGFPEIAPDLRAALARAVAAAIKDKNQP